MIQRSCVALAALVVLVAALVPTLVAPASAEDEKAASGPLAFETPEALVEAMIEASSEWSFTTAWWGLHPFG